MALQLLTLAWRRALREGWWSLLCGIPITGAVLVVICASALVDGIDDSLLKTAAQARLAAMRITAPPDTQHIPAELSASLEGLSWTSRAKRAAVLRSGHRLVVQLVAIEERDQAVFDPGNWTVEGLWPPAAGVAIGSNLARQMQLSLGDQLLLESDWHSGGQNAKTYSIQAIVETGFGDSDQRSIWLTQTNLVELRGAPLISEILLQQEQPIPTPKGWTVDTPKQVLKPWLELNQRRRAAFLAFSWLLMTLAGVGILSTTMMRTQLRRKELGMLRAIGLSRNRMLTLLTLESTLIASVFAIVGGLIAAAVVWRWQSVGIDLRTLLEIIGSAPFPLVIYARIHTGKILWVIAAAISMAALAALLTVWRLSQCTPADLLEEK